MAGPTNFCGSAGGPTTTGYLVELLINGVVVRTQKRVHIGSDETPITGSAELFLEDKDVIQIRIRPISRITYQASANLCTLSVRQLRHFG